MALIKALSFTISSFMALCFFISLKRVEQIQKNYGLVQELECLQALLTK